MCNNESFNQGEHCHGNSLNQSNTFTCAHMQKPFHANIYNHQNPTLCKQQHKSTEQPTHLAELIPELVELRIVGPALVVAELVEHGVEHLLVGDEVVVAAGAPQTQLDLDARADIEPQQPRVPRPDQSHPPTRTGSINRSIGRREVTVRVRGGTLTRTRRGP